MSIPLLNTASRSGPTLRAIPQFYCTFCDKQVYTTITRIGNSNNKCLVRCCMTCGEIIDTVPAPRLVGIEPNPGPPRKNKKSRNQSTKLLTSSKNINPFSLVIKEIDEKHNSQTYRHRVVGTSTVPVSSTGNLLILPLNGVQNATDWTQFQNIYDEFRVLGLRVHSLPRNRYTQAVTNGYYVFYDNDNTTVSPASNSIAASYANSHCVQSNEPWTYDGIAISTRDGPEIWIDTAAPNGQIGVVIGFTTTSFGSSYTASDLRLEYIVEFRGRR